MEKVKRILVVGDNQVGKTQFLKNIFGHCNSHQENQTDDGMKELFGEFLQSQCADAEAEILMKQLIYEDENVDGNVNVVNKTTNGCRVHTYLLNDHYDQIG